MEKDPGEMVNQAGNPDFAGEADLRAWFVTESQQRLGAYFVDIQRLT